ncbi:MAG: transglycosylase domain-containing protein [Clostridia bacterium]|nr:transglycosylase domain-containing protein [Clostridia bacterium]
MAEKLQKWLGVAKKWFTTLPARLLAFVRSLWRPTAQQKKRRRRVLRRLWQTALTVVLVGVISACIVGSVLVVYVMSSFNAEDFIPVLGEMSMDNRSVIHVKNDKGDFVPYHNLQGGNSVWTDLNKIPLHMQNAVVAIEDERFWDHEGVDWKRTVSAFANLFLNRVFHLNTNEFGGSSITQQLIKVTTQKDDHSIQRKINEILAAMELEKSEYTKEQVLEGYLNNVPLTGDYVGVGIGARYYFGKEIQDCTLAECAVLASITNNPSVYHPYRRPENVRQRQKLVLAKMYELEFITRDEYLNALNEELVFKSNVARQETQDYYVDLVVEDVINALMKEYGYTYNYAENMVFYGGLNIYSAEDPKQQAAVETVFADDKNYPTHRTKDEEDPQSSFFAMDYTGRVVATVGGRGVKTTNRAYNRSTQSLRSPGSSIKPITSYGPAIALDVVHYSSLLRDAPITLPNGKKWPHNYEVLSTPDNGNVLLGYALQKSLNTTAARLVQQLGTQRSYDYATQTFGLSTLVESRGVNGKLMTDVALSPLALGAFTDGVTARDMTAAYGVFGNGGYYSEPYTYYKVTTGSGEDETTLLEGGPKSTNVLDPQSAYVIEKLLERVTVYGTAADIGKSWKGWQVFGKTGTSESEKDVYFSGGTAYMTASCWFGYDNNQILAKNQTSYAKTLWSKAMKALHKNLQIKDFEQPSGITVAEYCEQTGELATDACKSKAHGVYKSSFMPGLCSVHGGNPVTTTTQGQQTTTSASAGATESTTTTSQTTTATTTTQTVAEEQTTTTAAEAEEQAP